MIFQGTATQCGPLFGILTELLLREEEPDAMEIARLRREATATLKTPYAAQGHVVCSGIAALVWDVKTVEWHVREAIRLDGSLDALMNVLVTFGLIGRPDLALPYALAAAKLAPSRASVINEVSSVLISLGRVAEALELQLACSRIDKHALFEIDAYELGLVMADVEVDETWLGEEFGLALSVFNDAKVRIREFSYVHDVDPDGSSCLSFEFGFGGSLDDEFRLDDQLAVRFSQTDRWNPSRLAICTRHMDHQEYAVVA